MDTNIEKVSLQSTTSKSAQKLEQGSVGLAYVKGFAKGIWEYWSEKFQTREDQSDIGLDTFEKSSNSSKLIAEPKDLQARLDAIKAQRSEQTPSTDTIANQEAEPVTESADNAEQTSEEQENSPDNIEHQEREITIDGKTMTVNGVIETLPNGRKLFRWESPDGKFTYFKNFDTNNPNNFAEGRTIKLENGTTKRIMNGNNDFMKYTANDIIDNYGNTIEKHEERVTSTGIKATVNGQRDTNGNYYETENIDNPNFTDGPLTIDRTKTLDGVKTEAVYDKDNNLIKDLSKIELPIDFDISSVFENPQEIGNTQGQQTKVSVGTSSGKSPASQSTTSQGIEQGGTENISNTSSPSTSTNAETPQSGGVVNNMAYTEEYAEAYADFKIQVQNLSNSKEICNQWKELVRAGNSPSEASEFLLK